MLEVTKEFVIAFDRRLEKVAVPAWERPDYRKWMRFYLDFCHKYGHPPRAASSLEPFLTDLAVRQGVAASTQNQAFNALLFFYRHVRGREFGKLEGVVRAIVGALVRVGEGKLTAQELAELVRARKRTALVETSPAKGLLLWKVFY